MTFADRMSRIKESPTLATTAKAKALAARGIDVVNLGAGEPDFDTPEFIKQACVEALKKGMTKYGPVAGLPELRAAIGAKLKRENGLEYPADQIVVTCGSKEAIFGALQVLVNPRDEVIIPAPYWVSYSDEVLLCDGRPVILPTPEANGFKLTPGALQQAITPSTKCLILNNPCNPTGSVYAAQELAALGAVCADHGIWVIADEIYEYLTYPPATFTSFGTAAPRHRERTILVNGVSKAYAMTGWRIGCAAGPRPFIQQLETWQGQVVTHPTSFAQVGATAAYTGGTATVAQMRAEFCKRRDLVMAVLGTTPHLTSAQPAGAFFVFPNVAAYVGKRWQGKPITDSAALADYLLDQSHVAVVAGEAFGQPGYVRLSYAVGRDLLAEGLKRFAKGLSQLET